MAILNQTKIPALALLLAISLLMTGLPLVASGGAAERCPSIALDICTPAAIANTSIQATLPLPPTPGSLRSSPTYCGRAAMPPKAGLIKLAAPPDLPPPKS